MICVWTWLIWRPMKINLMYSLILKRSHPLSFQICLHLWRDQGKWVTCRQYSILSFQYNLPAHIKSYILIHTPLQSDIWFKRYEQFFEFQNNVKHRNMSSVLAYNSKWILATSDSFLLIMSHMCLLIWMHCVDFK